MKHCSHNFECLTLVLLAGFVQFDNDDIELFAVDSDKRGVEILDGDAREGTSLDSFEFTVAEFCG